MKTFREYLAEAELNESISTQKLNSKTVENYSIQIKLMKNLSI